MVKYGINVSLALMKISNRKAVWYKQFDVRLENLSVLYLNAGYGCQVHPTNKRFEVAASRWHWTWSTRTFYLTAEAWKTMLAASLLLLSVFRLDLVKGKLLSYFVCHVFTYARIFRKISFIMKKWMRCWKILLIWIGAELKVNKIIII